MAAHRYWRLYINTGNDASNISAQNIEFHATVGGPTICTGGTGTSSSQYSSWNVNLAFSNTGQFATAGGAPQWVAYDLGAGVYSDVAEVLWQARTDGYPSQTPNDVQMQFSDDGVNWTNWGTDYAFGSSWSIGEVMTFAITQPVPQSVAKLAQYIVEGPNQTLFVSKQAEYVVEGSPDTLFVSKLAMYIIEAPTIVVGNFSQAMMGSF